MGAFLTAAWLRLRTAFRRRQLDQDLEDELQFHLAMREERMEGTGADVPFRARQKFGNVTAVKETCRELWTFGWIEAIWQDVRYGLRQLRVNRGFTAAAILTLSLGIAATATIYAVCAALVWQKLPLPEADRLAVVLQALPGNSHLWIPSSPGDVEDIRKGSTVLESLASWENATAKIVDVDGEPVRVDQARVTANFFDVLGVAPRFGRSFSPGADQPGRESEVVLSDGLWRRRFRADRRVIGTSIRLNDRNYTVIGVMPAGFAFPRASKELWTPLALTPGERVSRNTPRLDSVGRLKPGRTLREAQAELDGVSRRLEMAYPQTNTKRRFSAWTAQRYVTGDYAAQFARLLLGAAIFVLLIACVNVANLQFARGTSRTREVAIRQALGASRWRIVAQLLTESLVIAAAGAGLGIAMANFGLRAIRNGMPQELQRYSSGWANLDINAEVLAFALAAAALSGILAGFAPALRSSRPNLVESLKEGVQSSAGLGRRRARSALLAAEIALTVVLLAGAGLMVRGFHKLMSGKTGFEPAAVLSLRVEVDAESHRTPEQVSAFYADVLERIAALPGVQTTAAASSLPFSRHAQFSAFTIRDREAQAGAPATAQFERVSPGYFSTMRIPLRAGRLLSSRDGPHAPLSVVISEEMARQWWPGEAFPIGKQIRIAALNSRADMATIVGVVGGVKASVLDRTPGPVLYLSCEQAPAEGMDIAVRAAGDPLSLATPVRLAVKAVDPGQPATDITTLERMRQNEVIGLTYAALLMSIFGGVALAMSWVGVYGMTAYLVLRQTHEIGIRMALGASPRAVLRGVFGRSARPVFAGIALGVLLSLGVARALAAVIWGVSATDPGTFAGVPALLAVAVGFAIYVPARRILNTNPMTALRSE